MDDAVQHDTISEDGVRRRTPVHLWIVGVLALLWNSYGAYNYLMTRLRDTEYLAQAMPGVDPNATLAWVDGFPIWAQFGWGLGVWMGLLGAVLLLARSRHATWVFGLSFVGAILGLGYQILAAPPMPGAEGRFDPIPYVVIAVAAALLLYSQAMRKRGVLR